MKRIQTKIDTQVTSYKLQVNSGRRKKLRRFWRIEELKERRIRIIVLIKKRKFENKENDREVKYLIEGKYKNRE